MSTYDSNDSFAEFKNENNINWYVELFRKFIFLQIKNIRGIYFEDEEKTNGDIPNVKPTSSNRKQTW